MSKGWQCPQCGMVSFNLNDAEEGYCGHCHQFFPGYERREREERDDQTQSDRRD